MYHVIIADDEMKIREGLVNLFPWSQLGFKIVAEAANGQEVLDYLAAHDDIDVILTDIRMPVLDGIGLSKQMVSRNIRVVFFSSYTDFSYTQSALKNQVFDYLLKPVKYEALVDCFERLKTVLDEEHSVTSPIDLLPEQGNDPIPAVLAYMEKHYRDCTLAEAAKRVYLTPAYLSTLFHNKQGISFSDALQKIRMEKAKELLHNPEIRQYQIADLVGYDNPKSFTRAFKNYFGVSPQDYRNGGTLS
ncbi:MAG: response regulator [Lachnospiraceae bacterium]|nr:response regulator [Lachnospiraceae bacterium]